MTSSIRRGDTMLYDGIRVFVSSNPTPYGVVRLRDGRMVRCRDLSEAPTTEPIPKPPPPPATPSALDTQVGGGHYKDLAIQPTEYIHANNIPFIEGCIIKYATRWRAKGGMQDLNKIIHFTQLLIELETRAATATQESKSK